MAKSVFNRQAVKIIGFLLDLVKQFILHLFLGTDQIMAQLFAPEIELRALHKRIVSSVDRLRF